MVIITVIKMILVIITVIMVLCLGISLQGIKISESQTGRQVRLSSLIPWDLGHAESSPTPDNPPAKTTDHV